MQDNKESQLINTTNDAIIHTTFNSSQPQLTPTGKISYAKTRVYTQRYRKAWEQMPDFKGWLTSVPHQPTRAYCTFCRKNLHAHRLSLLKHTCTMKHQRGALLHQKQASEKTAGGGSERELKILPHDDNNMCENAAKDELQEDEENEEDDEDIEYVVERLDDEVIDDEQSKEVEDEEYAVGEEDENLSIVKKMKVEHGDDPNRPDTLAEAMAHVHSEYLDENEESVNVELDMVVESVDTESPEVQIVSMRSDHDEDENQITLETYENDDNSTDYDNTVQVIQETENETENPPINSSCKSSLGGESSDAISENDDIELLNKTDVRRSYLSRPSTARTISVLPVTRSGNNGAAISSNLKKTITLTSVGKTVTLDTSSINSYPGGPRFLQLNTKGKGNNIVIGGKIQSRGNPANERHIKIAKQQSHIVGNSVNATYSVAGTSQSTPRKHIILKSVNPLVQTKKSCITTHVLDTSKGLPVGGLQISLYKLMDGRWTFLSESNTTADGRCADLMDPTKYSFTAGRYKLHFDIDKYYTLRRIETMYPFIEIIFDVKNPTEHYHIPVLISPFGYTTYRGS